MSSSRFGLHNFCRFLHQYHHHYFFVVEDKCSSKLLFSSEDSKRDKSSITLQRYDFNEVSDRLSITRWRLFQKQV